MQGLVFWLETSWRSVQAVSRAQRGDCKRCVYPQVCVARQVQPGMVPGSHSLFHILRSCHCPGPRYRNWRVPSHGPWSFYRATAHSLSEGETEALFRKEPGRRRCLGVTVEPDASVHRLDWLLNWGAVLCLCSEEGGCM